MTPRLHKQIDEAHVRRFIAHLASRAEADGGVDLKDVDQLLLF